MQISVNESGPGLSLERRLLGSYLLAFAAIFVAAAVAAHFAFVAVIQHQTIARLEDVARAGIRSVIFVRDGLAIDKQEISNKQLLTPEQGLQWFDRYGRLLAAEGFTPPAGGHRKVHIVTMPILNPNTHQYVGSVTAGEWSAQERADVWYLDTGLLLSALLASVASAAGALALARRAVQPVQSSLRTLREFTDNAAHELRGPLTVIATSADAALRDPKREPEHDRQRFESIADGARQMSRLTSDLLMLAGADRSLERELFLVDLAAMLDKLVVDFRGAFAGAGIEFQAAAPGPASLYGNPHQIERVVANLLENALRYTRKGGNVSLEIRRHGAELQVVISDSGIGIAPEHLERIFERFWRADPVRSPEGSGLGLAIARALARRHGGDVTVTSRVGRGSTFIASFPVRPRAIRLLGLT
ncbi:MAG: HAMP domain-containing sensor histidine kinase [Candidatus Cybelea sp.]